MSNLQFLLESISKERRTKDDCFIMKRYIIYLKLMTILTLLMSSINLHAYDTEIDGLYYDWISNTSSSGSWARVSLEIVM